MSQKKSTGKGSTKGKAEGSRRRPSVKERGRAIVADAKGYSDETRHAIKNALDENSSDLAELVRRAEGGDDILDARGPVVGTEPDSAQAAAHVYAQRAYDAALDHYHANHADPFALSRLAVVYGEQAPGAFNMVVTLPGAMWEHGPREPHVRGLIQDAERIARTLEDPDCSEAYRQAFGSVYVNHLLNNSGVDVESPAVVRVLLPLIMLDLWGERPADADTALEILSVTLREALNSHKVCERTRAANG